MQRLPIWVGVLLYSLSSFPRIAWYRLWRPVEWFVLCRVILRRKRLAQLLIGQVSHAFTPYQSAYKVTGECYTGRGPGHAEQGKIYWEAPLAITVWGPDGPLFGMAVEFRPGAVCIRQLQGVAGVQVPPELRNWPKLMTSACIRLARLSGIRQVRLYRAHMSLFYQYPLLPAYDEATLTSFRGRMRRRYDGTARQMGLLMRQKWGEWTHPTRA